MAEERRNRAALLTPPAPSGIAVILVRGPASRPVLSRLFRTARGAPRALPSPGRARHGFFFHGGEPLDEVLLVRTGPERFEVCCHGGAAPAEALLRALSAEGIRIVPWSGMLEPRTLRYDLARALVQAGGPLQAVLLAHQGAGVLPCAFRLLARALEERERSPSAPPAWIASAARFAARLEGSYTTGRFLARAPRVVLSGAVNAGKSTLFNAVLGERRALTSRIPGTTRDPVEALFLLEGFPVRLFDLPGTGGTGGGVRGGDPHGLEQAARSAAERCRRDADLEVVLLDASRPGEALRSGAARPTDREGRVIFAWNKVDLLRRPLPVQAGGELRLSALRRRGIDALLRALSEALGLSALARSRAPRLFDRRQAALVRSARRAFEGGGRAPGLRERFLRYTGNGEGGRPD